MSVANPKPNYLSYLHAFRGIAILAIIGAHAWSLLGSISGVQESNPDYIWLYSSTETLFHGATLFFALISGLLYTRVMSGMPWKNFFKNKLLNVLLPYVTLCTLLTAISWPGYVEYGKANNITFFFPEVLSQNIVFGQAQIHFWYIPVLMVLFALTPLLNALRKPGNGIGLLLLAAVPLLVSRSTYPNLLSWQTVVFFLGAYALGMLIGERLNALLAFCQRHWPAMLLALAILSAVNFVLFFWEYQPSGFTSWHQSVVYCQKLLAAALILYGLHNIQDRLPKWLITLGTYSFSLYFLHFTFIWILSEQFMKLNAKPSVPEIALAGLAIYMASVLLSLLLSMGLRKLLGKYSRMVIGA